MKNKSIPSRSGQPQASTLAPQRVMRIVEALAGNRDGLSLTELSRQTLLPKTSLFSLLHSLHEGGYVVSEGKTYRLGSETFRIAAMIHREDSFPGNVHDLLEKLQQDCGETVMIAVPTEDWLNLTYVDVIESNSSLRFSIKVGAYRPLYSTTVGKIMLAYASSEQRGHYFEQTKLIAFNPETITEINALTQELDHARLNGYIFSSGSVQGATGLAAPLFDTKGQLLAAVGTAGPSDRFKNQQQRLTSLIIDCAEAMSRRLGYAGKYPLFSRSKKNQ